VLEDRVSKALAEKGLVTHEDVGGAQLARFQFADKALGLGEGPHQISPVPVKLIILDSSIDNSIRIVIQRERMHPALQVASAQKRIASCSKILPEY